MWQLHLHNSSCLYDRSYFSRLYRDYTGNSVMMSFCTFQTCCPNRGKELEHKVMSESDVHYWKKTWNYFESDGGKSHQHCGITTTLLVKSVDYSAHYSALLRKVLSLSSLLKCVTFWNISQTLSSEGIPQRFLK